MATIEWREFLSRVIELKSEFSEANNGKLPTKLSLAPRYQAAFYKASSSDLGSDLFTKVNFEPGGVDRLETFLGAKLTFDPNEPDIRFS